MSAAGADPGQLGDGAVPRFASPSPSAPPPDLSVVIVSWQVRDLLRRCLQSVLAAPGWLIWPPPNAGAESGGEGKLRRLQVIVVDNASSDGSAQMARAEFPQITLIANDTNRGFTGGSNQGIDASSGRYVLLLNPDTEAVGDALTTMMVYMDSHPNVGLLGPQLRFPDGSLQSSRRRFPTLATALVESTILQGFFQRSRILSRYYMLDTLDDAIQDVDWVVGAAMFVRRAAIDQVGGLDEGFFMYSEELDWCRRIKAAPAPSGGSWQVMYLPAARVVHHEGRSSAQAPALKQIQFHASKVRYFGKYHGRLAAGALRFFLLGTYVYQTVEESAKWLVGHKRPLRAQRLSIYWQVLRSGLRPKGMR
jgi:N-acetylglucosaminyl-diphospho-decaprenol L-rhamnosyltransferase